jgi:hypothetical protein
MKKKKNLVISGGLWFALFLVVLVFFGGLRRYYSGKGLVCGVWQLVWQSLWCLSMIFVVFGSFCGVYRWFCGLWRRLWCSAVSTSPSGEFYVGFYCYHRRKQWSIASQGRR